MDAFLATVSKREVRDYSDRAVPDDVKRRIFEAGRVAGSSANKQQRYFVVVGSEEAKRRAAEAVYTPTNLTGCAFAVAIGVFGGGPVAFDAGRAAQNMMLAAWNDGVGSCPNGMPDRGAAAHALGLAPGEEPAIILSFGYPAKPLDPESRAPEQWVAAADRQPFEEMFRTI
jgi:nitroreductase